VDDDWHPSYPRVAGWLLAIEDIAVPPLEVHLPEEALGSGLLGPSEWSIVLSRGCVPSLDGLPELRSYVSPEDTAARLYLLDSNGRLWASRRVDEAFDAVYQRTNLDGRSVVRHALAFAPVSSAGGLDGGEGELGGGCRELWSLEVIFMSRADSLEAASGRLGYWRCPIRFEGGLTRPTCSYPQALESSAQTTSSVSAVDCHVLPKAWHEGVELPSDLANPTVATGLPCYPMLHWQESIFESPEDKWRFFVGRDSALQAPKTVHN
jgi:hypothetical protein